jgi:hypothetical protein
MTWKSYAAVSGATVLAGWLASAPPANVSPTNAPAQQPKSSRVPAPADTTSDIEQQAARLETLGRHETVYTQPSRNPFRFGPARAAAREAAAPPPVVVEPVAPVPLPPAVSLSGIAEDQVDGHTQRTAVLSSPQGVLLLREGDDVLGEYRVGSIDSDAVELVRNADGTRTRIALKP